MSRREPPKKKFRQSTLSFNKPSESPGSTRNLEQHHTRYADVTVGLFPGYQVFDVPGNGDCMFSAVAHQLSLGKSTPPESAQAIRMQLVDYIRAHPSLTDDIINAGD